MIMTYFVTSLRMPDLQNIRREMSYIVSDGVLNSTHSLIHSLAM